MFEETEGGVLIAPAPTARRAKAEAWLRRVQGKHRLRFTADELMRLTRGED